LSHEWYSQKKISQIFGTPISKTGLYQAEEEKLIPIGKRSPQRNLHLRGWGPEALPIIGERWGFLHKPPRSLCYAVFTTKGGVLKTNLALNLARMLALHNLKTCVIGLDIQGDITTSMGHNHELEELDDLKTILEKLNETKGLPDIFNRTHRYEDVIKPTEIPTLFYIPETPELVALNEALNNTNRREYWLKEKIILPLKEIFDVIIIDCSPNWNRLITNALVACDILLSPLECKINNFRNFKVFRHFLSEFKTEMGLDFESIFIPTKTTQQKKLARDIQKWYQDHVPGCTRGGIRESVFGEEACALKISLPEHAPTHQSAQEMRELLKEIHERSLLYLQKKKNPPLQPSLNA
jgi:chromosome partitioning protein